MKKRTSKLLSLLLTLAMVLGMLPAMSITAAAEEPGKTVDNPVVCTTFAEFKTAMESTTVTYVKLNGVSGTNGCMPEQASLAAAISNTTYKVLTIEGTNTFYSPLNGMNDCLIWPRSELIINGTGTLKYEHGNTGGTGAVINMASNVLLTIDGNVTLEGGANGNVFGYAIFAQAGTTTINGGSFIGYDAMIANSAAMSAVSISSSANLTINGGKFSASLHKDSPAGKKAHSLSITSTSTGTISIKEGTFSQGINIDATGKTIETCGYFDTAKASITAGGRSVEATASTDVLKNTEVIVTDTSVIGSVTVAVTTPVAGAAPATPSSDTANVTVSNHMWTKRPEGTGISSFEAGKTYRCTVVLNPASGYTFKSNATVTIGGQTATIDSQTTTGITAHVDFTTPAVPVSSVAISVTAPTAGATPSAPTTSTANVSIVGYQWKISGGSNLDSSTAFEAGNTYRLEMTINPTTGQTLSTTATATVNGNAATIMDQTASYLNCYYDFTVESTIDTIAATVTPPVAGATPDLNLVLPAGVQICTSGSNYWSDMSDGTETGTVMPSTDTYIAGRTYRCRFTVEAKPGYVFTNPISAVTLNGNATTIFFNSTNLLVFDATFVATAAPITEYGITVTDGKATVGAGTEISKAAEGTIITLTANAAPSGKVFDKWVVESGDITLADASSATTTFTMSAGAVSVKATYKDKTGLASITNANVTVTAPVKGGTPANAATADTQYTVANTSWEPVPGSTFAASTVYSVVVTLEAKEGYQFTDSTVFTINGNSAKIVTRSDEEAKISFTFPATASTSSGTSGGGGGGVSTYAITVESAKNGDVTSSHKSAAKGTTVTLTVEPDKGYTLETITATDASGNKLKLTEKDGKYTFTMTASKVTVKATFMEDNSMLNFFVDVPADAYYFDAVLWAAEEGITGGVDATHFAPNATCTRAQAVTFLWRAAGSPAPKSSDMPFTDVAEGSYYYDAVLWAVENGITKGTSDTTFTPNAKCTRAQIVTFLWRSQKSPASDSVNPFTDVAADAYYSSAVLWAVENGITAGTTATTFSPNNDCTRAQIVTFLFRCLGK